MIEGFGNCAKTLIGVVILVQHWTILVMNVHNRESDPNGPYFMSLISDFYSSQPSASGAIKEEN